MNILQINSVCGVGSTGRIATDLHTALVKQGHRSTIAYGRGSAFNCSQTLKIGSTFDTYNHVLRTRLLDQHGYGSSSATREFLKNVCDLQPDVIHLHNLHGYYLNIGILFDFLYKYNKPVVWTLHDCWAFTGHCAHFDFVGCMRWMSECFNCPQTNLYPKSFLVDRSQENHKDKSLLFANLKKLTLVTPSNWLSSLVNKSFLKVHTTKVIPNGIDLTVFQPTIGNFRTRHGLGNKFVILGVASHWDERKGYDCFVSLAKQLKPDEIIVLVGVSKRQIANFPVEVIGIEKTMNIMELAEIYSAADVFVNPTLEDNFPTTNLESLACGTPVLTFASGGSPESVTSDCGLVVERGNLKTMYEAIQTIKLRTKSSFSTQCRLRANDLYSKELSFSRYISLYESLTFE